ncbi:hypothetical protein EBB07_06105 [Paenibacillaceae bacterium]|nr:hypothetical protein EBB07_06105 [Paenibacillaceae bacterium]
MNVDRKFMKMRTYSIANEQLDQISDSLQNLLRQKRQALRVREFMTCLAQDPALDYEKSSCGKRSITELLQLAEYPIKQELVYDYSKKRFVGSNQKPHVDMAELFSMLLRRLGVNATFEDFMDHMLNGGSINGFIQECLESKPQFTKQAGLNYTVK